MLKYRPHLAILLLLMILLTTVTALAGNRLEVATNKSRVLMFSQVERVAVANPDIADVIVVSGTEVLLVGKNAGFTTLHIWTPSGRESYEVEVASDDAPLAAQIQSILGYPGIKVSKVNKSIILEGKVNDQYQKKRAEQVAGAYSEKVVNLLEITRPTQVKIEARILEINKEKADNLGIKWGNEPSIPGTFRFGQSWVNSEVTTRFRYAPIDAQLEALVKDGVVKILSQPSMITLSGSKADIIVGGEIPVPVGLDNGKITVEWKEYGIKLDIEPEVNGEGLINSKVKAEVSSLDWTDEHRIEIAGDLKIPPIKKRKAESAIALSSGQTLAIGGLMTSETARDVIKVPFLSKLPILGGLFKSSSFQKNETELLILVTPTIVDPSEYLPNASSDMKKFVNENPWGGDKDGGKNQGSNR